MSDLSHAAATTKFRSGRDSEPPRSSRKLERMSVRTAVAVMRDLKPIFTDLIERPVRIIDPSSGSEMTVHHIKATGNLLAATVLQALSAETGLKLLYEFDQPYKLARNTHDLATLFGQLSSNMQERLAKKYRERVLRYAPSGLSQDVKSVFSEHAKTFVLWRYMYEDGPSGPGYSGAVTLAIDAMVDLAEELDREASPPSS